MLLNEKISMIRKLNNLTQESFAEELGVSRQALSKWENGMSVPDVAMLIKIADYYNLTLDQLVRDDINFPIDESSQATIDAEKDEISIDKYMGKVCDVSMNSFLFSTLRNVKIVGKFKNLVCFESRGKYGYFNFDKSQGILIKSETETYDEKNELVLGKCSVYVNKGTYFGGNTYLFSEIHSIKEDFIEIKTGESISFVDYNDISVIKMSEK